MMASTGAEECGAVSDGAFPAVQASGQLYEDY